MVVLAVMAGSALLKPIVPTRPSWNVIVDPGFALAKVIASRSSPISVPSVTLVTSKGSPTVKSVALVAKPLGVITVMMPVVAPAGTVVAIDVAVVTPTTADVPLNVTDVAPARPLPAMVTLVPAGPYVGVKPLIVGVTAKLLALVADPAGTVTLILPVVASTGTTAVSWLPT